LNAINFSKVPNFGKVLPAEIPVKIIPLKIEEKITGFFDILSSISEDATASKKSGIEPLLCGRKVLSAVVKTG